VTVETFEGKAPRLGDGCWVHPSADVIGDVTLGARCWIGPGARLRGDYGTIVLGDCSAIDAPVTRLRRWVWCHRSITVAERAQEGTGRETLQVSRPVFVPQFRIRRLAAAPDAAA